MRRHPTRHIKRYVKEVEEMLGVAPESAYQLTDYTKKLAWGKHRALMRVHFGILDALEQLLKGRTKPCGLQLVQLLRAVHQASCCGVGQKREGLTLYIYIYILTFQNGKTLIS